MVFLYASTTSNIKYFKVAQTLIQLNCRYNVPVARHLWTHGSFRYVFIYFAGDVRVFDNTLQLVHNRGVYGRIWLSGCVYWDCLVTLPISVTMTVRKPEKNYERKESFFILPRERPFLVDEDILGLHGEEANAKVEVVIQIGEAPPHTLLAGEKHVPCWAVSLTRWVPSWVLSFVTPVANVWKWSLFLDLG